MTIRRALAFVLAPLILAPPTTAAAAGDGTTQQFFTVEFREGRTGDLPRPPAAIKSPSTPAPGAGTRLLARFHSIPDGVHDDLPSPPAAKINPGPPNFPRAGRQPGAHMAISLGDGRTIEARRGPVMPGRLITTRVATSRSK